MPICLPMDNTSQERKKLHVEVRNPERILFQGDVASITSYNKKGLFDVLPIHENFISIIEDVVILRTSEGEETFPVTSGVIKVEKNNVQIFLGPENVE